MDIGYNPEIITDEDISSKPIDQFPLLPSEMHHMLTSSDNEIVIDLNMNLLSRNKTDIESIPENKQIYNNNYWIPVPSGTNPDEYILAFIRHFELSMSNALTEQK
jgi:hypothetical protein